MRPIHSFIIYGGGQTSIDVLDLSRSANDRSIDMKPGKTLIFFFFSLRALRTELVFCSKTLCLTAQTSLRSNLRLKSKL